MPSQPKHIYDIIDDIVNETDRFRIVTQTGAELLLPLSASDSVKHMVRGSAMLIDLSTWDTEGGAFVAVFRQRRYATSFGIGDDACQVKLPKTI